MFSTDDVNGVEVVPAIIPESKEHLVSEAGKVKDFVSRIQVDVMDGSFAPTVSWPYRSDDAPSFATFVQEGGFPFQNTVSYEMDLMVAKPEEQINTWIECGASALIVHVESTGKIDEFITEAHNRGVEVGLAISPATPNDAFLPWVSQVDFVQFMGNDKIGYHGVELDVDVLEKITYLRDEYRELIIGVDIGVNRETAPKLVAAGVNRLVSGSAIFGSDSIKETVKYFQTLG